MKKIIALSFLFLTAAGCNLLTGGGGNLGVLKTIDGGSVWLAHNAVEAMPDRSISGVSVSEMAFAPNNREEIYFSAIEGGMWKTTNSGETWQHILSTITVYDFHLEPSNPNIIFAAGIFNNHGKIIKTTDGGKTWSEIYNEASVGNAVNTITANPNNPAEVFAALNSGIIIKSTDAGNTWTAIKDYKNQAIKIRYSRLNNSMYILFRTRGLLKSTDGGNNWQDLTAKLTDNGGFFTSNFIGNTAVGNLMKLGLDDQSAGVIYLTTENGLYKTTDDGRNWQRLNLPFRSGEQAPRAIASTMGGMLAYTSVGSTILKTLDGGLTWQTQSLPVSKATVNKILIDPQLPQITYAGLLKP